MAIGDAAAAAGFDLVSDTLPANEIAEQMNKILDYLAAVKVTVDEATTTPTEGKLVKYGAGGRVNVATPLTGGNAVNRSYVDGL